MGESEANEGDAAVNESVRKQGMEAKVQANAIESSLTKCFGLSIFYYVPRNDTIVREYGPKTQIKVCSESRQQFRKELDGEEGDAGWEKDGLVNFAADEDASHKA